MGIALSYHLTKFQLSILKMADLQLFEISFGGRVGFCIYTQIIDYSQLPLLLYTLLIIALCKISVSG